MNLAEQLAIYAHAANLVNYQPNTVGGDCFVDWLPDQPDACVAINNTAGLPGDIKLARSTPGAQLRIRAANALAAKSRADALWGLFHGLGEIALPDGTWLVSCQAVGTPAPIGRDAHGRHEFTVNVLAEIRQPTVHRA